MNPPPANWQLCRLVDESLHSFTSSLEKSDLPISTKCEKQLLISLSHVVKQIQFWTNSNCVIEENVHVSGRKCSPESKSCLGNHDCLTKTIGDVILLLSVESRFVQHLAGNVLVAISDYLVASERNWSQFLKSLCICLELATSNTLFHSSDRSLCLNNDVSHAIIALQPKLERATWSSVACVVRVFHTILKRLKQDIDDELLLIYLNLTSECLANVPWDAMDQNWNTMRMSTDSFEAKAGQLESRTMFHGTLVQLFCSLVHVRNCADTAKFVNEHPVVCQISKLVPRLLSWCLGRENRDSVHMFEYFRHKILMLMIRLSSQIGFEDLLLFSWLDLIHEYFEDLLLLPLTRTYQADTLEGSPFTPRPCNTNKKKGPSYHLQRLVILLFLRCSFSLIGLTDRRAKQCGNDSDCKKKGLSELQWWLQIHLPSKMLGASECYFLRCTSFSISCLRLFIHEDDILFELLLLLFCVPSYAKQQFGQDINVFQEMNDDIIFHVSNILNPIHLFHLFLSELHYDHQVLLDYLISKDTGASSAEYLLRSLRVVCESWDKFVEFSLEGKATNMNERTKLSGKKRKVLTDGLDIWTWIGSSTEKGDSIPSSLGKLHQEAISHCKVSSRTYGLTFEKAKNCLLLLKSTLQNLHQKELFPYNPKVLLRRLTRFEELCFLH